MQLSPTSSVDQAREYGVERFNPTPRFQLAVYEHKNARGNRLSWDNRIWMEDLFRDNADRIVIPKSSKIGVTEWAICDVLTNARAGRNGMYVLPDQNIRNRFVTSRIDALLNHNATYREHVGTGKKGVHEKTLKTIYGTTWAFVGGQNPETFYEFDSDINIYDEFDQIPTESYQLAEDRTSAAKSQMWRKLGNPTIENHKIDAEYRASDARHWFIPCPHCGTKQELNWFDHFIYHDDAQVVRLRDTEVDSDNIEFNLHDARPICTHCGKPMDRLAMGEWVPEHEGNPIHGYLCSRLFGAPGNDGAVPRMIILEEFKRYKAALGNAFLMQLFWNNRLGLPYTAKGSRIDEGDLFACSVPGYQMPLTASGTIAGVDVGGVLHVHISTVTPEGKRRKVYMGTVPLDPGALDTLCKQYGVQFGVMDAMPETLFAKNWCASHPAWYRCFYGRNDTKDITVKVDHVENKVEVGRTETLDDTLAQFQQRQVELPCDYVNSDNGEFVKQMIAPVRIIDEESDPPRFIWDEGGRPDHHRHADNYERIAMRLSYGATGGVYVL